MIAPFSPRILQLPKSQTTVVVEPTRLYVQSFDAYGYQRELIIRWTSTGWVCHAYMHPGMRDIQNSILEEHVEKFVEAFLKQCDTYPSLLFNPTVPSSNLAMNSGFVHLHTRLLWGEPMNVKLVG